MPKRGEDFVNFIDQVSSGGHKIHNTRLKSFFKIHALLYSRFFEQLHYCLSVHRRKTCDLVLDLASTKPGITAHLYGVISSSIISQN